MSDCNSPQHHEDADVREAVGQVLDLIANKWTVVIICALSHGPKRYSALQREIGAVSQKMLTRALRNLERNGLVERQVYPIIPPKVEYALTPLGKTLIALLLTMNTWAGEHLPELEQARARYDQIASP